MNGCVKPFLLPVTGASGGPPSALPTPWLKDEAQTVGYTVKAFLLSKYTENYLTGILVY